LTRWTGNLCGGGRRRDGRGRWIAYAYARAGTQKTAVIRNRRRGRETRIAIVASIVWRWRWRHRGIGCEGFLGAWRRSRQRKRRDARAFQEGVAVGGTIANIYIIKEGLI
jgi:hypothetical protein